jgi:cytochrome c
VTCSNWAEKMKKTDLFSILLPALAVIVLSAADRATAVEAKALLRKAVAHYKLVGRQQALADFTARKAPFGDHGLYVVCFDARHIMVANGAFPRDVGTSGDTLRDVNGMGVAQSGWKAADGDSVVQYRWLNPATRSLEMKVAFFAKAGQDVCSVGVYRRE